MKKIAFLLLVGSVFVFNSCTKRGATGPQGPQGPQGNANVKGTDPFNVNYWQVDSVEYAYFAYFPDPDITQSIVDHGSVEIFLYYPSDGTWRNLPDIYAGTQIYYRFSVGSFTIYYGNVDGSFPASAPSSTYEWKFRTVIIAASQKQAHPNTNWKDYNEVMKVLAEDKAAAANASAGTTVSQ